MPRYKVVKGFALGIKPCYNPHMKDSCAICSKMVSADRRQLQPHVKTCSPACSVLVHREDSARDFAGSGESGGSWRLGRDYEVQDMPIMNAVDDYGYLRAFGA